MADNVPITAGAGTTVATDDIAGIHYQINKLAYGALDTATLVSPTNGLPVQVPGSVAVTGAFFQVTQPVSGTVTVGNASLAVTGAFFQTTQPVSGTVTVANASLAVTGTFFQATQPVSAVSLPLPTGAATETTLAALNTKVTAVNTGAVTISAALPAGTNALGTVSSVDVTATGTITAAAQSVALALNGKSGAAIQITGTWVGTLQFEGTVDGTNWATVNGVFAGTSTPGPTITANGLVRLTPSGLAQLRITATAWTSGTATITMRASDATGGTFLNQSLTAGTNVIGKVGIDQTTPGTTNLVSIGTNGTVALNAAIPAGANTIGTVNTLDPDTTGSGTITVTDAVVAAPAGAGATVSGTSTAGSYVSILCPGGDSAWNVQITGLTTGTLYFEVSLDSTNGIDGQWINVNGRQTGIVNTVLAGNSATNGVYRGNTSGAKYWRIRAVGALTGTPAIVVRLSAGTGAIFLNASIPAGTNNIGVTMGPTLTKGTQGTAGYSTQDLKDAGRVIFSVATVIAGVTAVTAEALLSMVATRDGVAAAAATSFGVTAGKRLRITGISVGMISTGAAVLSMRYALRINPAGAAAATSPILRILPVPSGAALAQAGGYADIEFTDGIELSGTQQFGITQIGSAISGTCWVSVSGFEY